MTKVKDKKFNVLKKFESFSDEDLRVMIKSIYQLYMIEKTSYEIAIRILLTNKIIVTQGKTYTDLEDRYNLLKMVCDLRGIPFDEKYDFDLTVENIVIELRSILAEEVKWIREHSYILDSFVESEGCKVTEQDVVNSRTEQFENVIKKITPQNLTLNLK